MFNLYPAIGAVNVRRHNLSGEASDFGSCKMKVDNIRQSRKIAGQAVRRDKSVEIKGEIPWFGKGSEPPKT